MNLKKGILISSALILISSCYGKLKAPAIENNVKPGKTNNTRNLKELQKEFNNWKFGMFMHFNMSTFVPGGWATGKEDPLKFNPKDLDMTQWADAAKSAHMKYGILTVKHTGGWCLWPSKTTDHDITMFKNYKNGKGDIVKEFVEAYRSRGLKVGLYYCFPLWGDDTWKKYLTLPDKAYTTGKLNALKFVKAQFKELLTNYGKIDMIWIDQYATPNGGLKQGDWQKFKQYIHQLQPNCLVIANTAKNYNDSDIIGYEYPYSISLPPLDNKKPSEVCDKLNAGWFANPGGPAVPTRSADYIVNKMLLPLVNRHSNYLLNCSPEATGKLHPTTVAMLKKIGEMWDPNNIKKYDKELYGIQKKPVSNIPNEQNMIALSFDKNWNAQMRNKAADTLKKLNATATFFINKESIEKEKPELRELVKKGNSLGNASTAESNVDKLPAMKVLEKISFIQNNLFWIKPAVAVMLPCEKYSWDLWTALNYYQLILAKPALTIDNKSNVTEITNKVHSGDIILIKYSPDALSKLDKFIKELSKKNIKAATIRTLLKHSTSRRLKAFTQTIDGKIESGRE